MSSELSSLESELADLRPRGLDPALLDRLEACTQGSWNLTSQAERHHESRLAAESPSPVPPRLMARLESVVAGTPFPTERKIVLFPRRETSAIPPTHADTTGRPWLAAAAAVALLGGLAAWFVPVTSRQNPLADATAPPTAVPAQPPSTPVRELVPAGFRRGLSEASDEGVVVRSADEAHRVLKLVYTDHVTLQDLHGRTVEVEQPRVEYILVPTRVD